MGLISASFSCRCICLIFIKWCSFIGLIFTNTQHRDKLCLSSCSCQQHSLSCLVFSSKHSSRPASVSCQTSISTGTIFSVSNLPGIFPAQVCVPQSSGLSCPHSMQSASILVLQQQCYYIPTPLIMPVTSSSQSAPQFAPVQPSCPVTASAPVLSEPTALLITIFQELLKKISQHGSEPTTMVSSPSLVASPVAPSVAPPAPTNHPLAPTMTDLRKNPSLASQADAIIASLPILSSLASTNGKNKSDLSFMSTIKCLQL